MRRGWSIIDQKGFSLVEVILSSAVFALFVTAFVGAYLYGQEATMLSGNRASANMLAEEGLEAVRNIRDAGYANLTNGTYGLTISGNQWNLSGSQDTNGVFTRQIIISSVDTKRKSVTANVTWQQNPQRTGTVSLGTRLTNWIIAKGDWSNLAVSASLDLSGNQDGVKIQTAGNYAYLIRSNTSNNFVVIDIGDPDAPSLVSTLSVAGTPTNIFVSSNYAYVTSNSNSSELQIVNISNPASPSIVGSYNASGNADANGVYVAGTRAYVVRANSGNDELCVVNVTNPASPVVMGTLNLGADGDEVVVSGSYAFIASGSNSQEVMVVNINNPALMSINSALNLSGNTDATTVSFIGNTLLVGQGTSFRTIDVSVPTTPSLLGTLAVSGNINDIAFDTTGNSVFIADQDSSGEFQVIDITTLSSPALSVAFNITGTNPLLGVAYSVQNDRVYGAGTLNTQELTVFMPQ